MPWKIRGSGSGGGGGGPKKDEHEGHLWGAISVEHLLDVQTRFGVTEAAQCHWLFCVECNTAWQDCMIFGAALVPRLVDGAGNGDIAGGRLGRGQGKAGQNAPWVLWDLSPEDEQLLEKWLDAHAVEMPSGAVEIDWKSLDPPPGADEAF